MVWPRLPFIAGFTMAAVLVLLALGEGTGPRPAVAQESDFFTSTPGPLAKEHAELDNESGCNDCHVNGTKAVDSNKCLDCHDHSDLKKRIRAGKGFHASAQVRGKACANCHVEHKGRGFDIMGWRTVKGGEDNFDHDLTGWPLRDKHAVLECKECHKNTNTAGRRTYLGEDKLCGSCHKRDQPHGFDRKSLMACERCHTEISWKPQKKILDFDHNKKSDAEFPQEGAHKDVSCGKCHPKARFNLGQPKPGNCGNSGCHESPHEGHLFDTKSCDWCHSPTFRTLKQQDFNHAARTRFELAGAHGTVECYECHTPARGKRKPSTSCANCHADDNPHRDRFKQFGSPPSCEKCHPESKFEPDVFNHGRFTNFRLTGKHARIDCRECHRGKKPFQFENFEKLKIRNDRNCMSCHEHENVHQRKFTDAPPGKKVMRDGERVQTCLECHETAGRVQISREAVEPIHGIKGRWPLTREHKNVDCVKCHPNDEFVGTPRQCGVRCHQDSLHEGRLGDECDKCHEPGRWDAVRFDHNSEEDATWPLLGLHKTVPACEDCHPGRRYADTPTACADEACHAKDDAHNGKLGNQCQDCHLETAVNIFDHNSQAEFKLDGAHLTTRCAGCHPSIEFKPVPKDCYGGGACHPEPEIHKGQYGTLCENCHNTVSFAQIIPLHDVGEFSLEGAHDRQPCERCHVDNRPLAGTGNFCINCHRQDDIHSNSLSPRCGECHSQWSFAPARFNHSTVGCNLTGLHRTLPCYDCHKSGNFGGLSPTCFGCHRDEVRGKDQLHQSYTFCGQCHTPTVWQHTPLPAATLGFGSESICR